MNLNSRGIINYLLLPLSWVFYLASRVRFLLYSLGVFGQYHSTKPIIIVGNITAGGSGKTPVVITLTRHLQAIGYTVGIISRGYGRASREHILINGDTTAGECGDEPLLIYLQTGAVVSVSKSKVEAVQAIEHEVDIIISDDGLQHYALARDIEVIVDSGVGNGWFLPAGPLREGVSRLRSGDIVLTQEHRTLHATGLVDARTGDTVGYESIASLEIHALCGIAHPERFFTTLISLGLEHTAHTYPDHHQFTAGDFNSLDISENAVIITTAKDWVKYKEFTENIHCQQLYYLAVEVQIDSALLDEFSTLVHTHANS